MAWIKFTVSKLIMKLIININNEVMLRKSILKHPIFKMGMCVHTCTHTHTEQAWPSGAS